MHSIMPHIMIYESFVNMTDRLTCSVQNPANPCLTPRQVISGVPSIVYDILEIAIV